MKKLLFSLVLLLIILCVGAHEYILLASKYRLQRGDAVEMRLFVADGFNIEEERPFQASKILKFEMITENGSKDLAADAKDGTYPVTQFTTDFNGLGLLHMERDYSRITLATPKFIDYLKEDHIEHIKPDTKKAEQRERYTRYIKCLVQSGPLKADTLFKTLTGQNFEIVLLQNPYRLKVGQSISAQIFFMGKPLFNKVITARNRTGNLPVITVTARTDKNGVCSFPLKRKGEWFIHATHMIACPDKSDADWESFWASYSFGME